MTSYRTIVIDPPWPIRWRQDPTIGKRHLDYATMPVTEIALLPVLDLADEAGCSVFLWTTNSFLPEALGIVRLWRFEYRFLWTWCKPTGLGGHPRIATEHIVYGTRGQVRQQLDRHAPQTLNWLEAPTAGHSVKPEVFLDLIESVSEGPYLEMFARRNRIGWDTWGNEALDHVEVASGL